MKFLKKSYYKFYLIIFVIFISLIYLYSSQILKEKDKTKNLEPIVLNLFTNVHPNLPWSFKAIKKKLSITPGEVTAVEYMVTNLDDKATTGIATFAYFPKQYGSYISKLNCFCFDAQTLKANEEAKYTLVLLIDPEVTKDSKTKKVKEVTIQFTFFDYKEYKKNKS